MKAIKGETSQAKRYAYNLTLELVFIFIHSVDAHVESPKLKRALINELK